VGTQWALGPCVPRCVRGCRAGAHPPLSASRLRCLPARIFLRLQALIGRIRSLVSQTVTYGYVTSRGGEWDRGQAATVRLEEANNSYRESNRALLDLMRAMDVALAPARPSPSRRIRRGRCRGTPRLGVAQKKSGCKASVLIEAQKRLSRQIAPFRLVLLRSREDGCTWRPARRGRRSRF